MRHYKKKGNNKQNKLIIGKTIKSGVNIAVKYILLYYEGIMAWTSWKLMRTEQFITNPIWYLSFSTNCIEPGMKMDQTKSIFQMNVNLYDLSEGQADICY